MAVDGQKSISLKSVKLINSAVVCCDLLNLRPVILVPIMALDQAISVIIYIFLSPYPTKLVN